MKHLLALIIFAGLALGQGNFGTGGLQPPSSGGGGGCTPPSTTNLISGNGSGGCANSGIVPATVPTSTVNDTNIQGAISSNVLTFTWAGTLAAPRLNANVVQSVVNDTNITGSISAQALTLGWTGTLAAARMVNAGVMQGDCTTTFPTCTISAGAITLAKMANLAANSFIGNNTGGGATPIALTIGQSKTLLAIACADLTNAAASCATDATNASNISSGLLAAARLNGHSVSLPANCEAASASGTAYTCTTTPSFTIGDGDQIQFEADVANTGSATLAVNGAAAATIKKVGGGTNLAANDLLANQWTWMQFDGTNWQMLGAVGNAVPTVTGGTCTNQAVTAISTSAVPTCTTLTSAYVDSSLALSARNINTTAPLGGGGNLTADRTLTCTTCATTTNGGALSATLPVTLSAAGVVALNISANLQVTGSNLDTIQGIQTSSTPQWLRVGLNQAADANAHLAITDNGAANTSGNGSLFQATTAASAGNQQFAPPWISCGNGWKTNATAASQPTCVKIENQPVQGAANPSSKFSISENANGGSYITYFTLQGDGIGPGVATFSATSLTVGNLITGNSNITAGTWVTLVGTSAALGGLGLGNGHRVAWASTTTNAASTGDTGLCRGNVGQVNVNDGSTTCTNYRDLSYRTGNLSGLVATYNNLATAGNGVSSVYAAVNLTGQTASIGTTNLQCGGAVCAAGDYRVSVYTVVTTTGTGTLSSTIGWNDATAARTITSTGIATTATNFERVDYTVKADGVNNLTYATTLSVSGTYSIDVTLERLR